MKWTVFDLEFTELLPPIGEPWQLHISCASILSTDETCPQVWHEIDGDYMSAKTIEAFIETLFNRVTSGHKLVTWGGSATDWRMLAKECPQKHDLIVAMALESIDVPMCSFVSIGMMMGLNAACMALGFTLKENDSSKSIPEMWQHDRAKVLQHVSNDSFATMYVLVQAIKNRSLPWLTGKGLIKHWDVHLRTVRECLQCEVPKVPFVILPEMNAKLMARWLTFES